MADEAPAQQSPLVSETERALRARIDELEHQLVAYDAALDGNLDLAEQIAPRAFSVRRNHITARLPTAVLRQAFRPDTLRRQGDATWLMLAREALRAMSPDDDPAPFEAVAIMANALRRASDLPDVVLGRRVEAEQGDEIEDAAYLHWLWSVVQPKTEFLSCALPEGDGYRPRLDLAANGRAMDDPVSGVALRVDQTSLPRTGQVGLPKDWCWLLTAWRLEVRDSAGWDCTGLQGHLQFSYNGRRLATRPLSDALVPRDEDLLVVLNENRPFEFEAEFQRGVVRTSAAADAPPPRLYVFLKVIARETSV